MNRLDVVTSRMHSVMLVVMGILFIPLALASVAMGVSGGIHTTQLGLGVLMLVAYGAVLVLVRRGRSRSVKYFSPQGLERNDGRFLQWDQLERVVHQVRTVGDEKRLWRTEIRFRNGEAAWVLPLRVENRDQVDSFVRRLPCEHAEMAV